MFHEPHLLTIKNLIIYTCCKFTCVMAMDFFPNNLFQPLHWWIKGCSPTPTNKSFSVSHFAMGSSMQSMDNEILRRRQRIFQFPVFLGFIFTIFIPFSWWILNGSVRGRVSSSRTRFWTLLNLNSEVSTPKILLFSYWFFMQIGCK